MQTIKVKKPKYRHKKKARRNTGVHVKTAKNVNIIDHKKTSP